MRVLRRWGHVDDVEPNDIERSDTDGTFTAGDIVAVEGRPKQTFRVEGFVTNHTYTDRYVQLLGQGPKASFGKCFMVDPALLRSL